MSTHTSSAGFEEQLDEMIDEYFPKDKRHARGQAILMKQAILDLIERERESYWLKGYEAGQSVASGEMKTVTWAEAKKKLKEDK